MLDQKLAEAMQRVLATEVERFPSTLTLQRLVDDGIGTKRGKSLYFTNKDREEMRAWLLARGYAIQKVDLSGMQRHERLLHTPNEKAGGGSVKRNRVSIKALSGRPLILGSEKLRLPDGCHLDADWTLIVGMVGHQCIMFVENYPNFDLIHQTNFDLPPAVQSPLVIYRGDVHESRADNVNAFLDAVELPVMAFVDIDPASISMVSRLRRTVGIIAPDPVILEDQLASPQIGRRDRFQAQYPSAGSTLELLPLGNPCADIWALMKTHRSAVMQERWIGDGSRCVLWSGQYVCDASRKE